MDTEALEKYCFYQINRLLHLVKLITEDKQIIYLYKTSSQLKSIKSTEAKENNILLYKYSHMVIEGHDFYMHYNG